MGETKEIWVTESVMPVAPGIVFDGDLPAVCLLVQRLKGYPDDIHVIAGVLGTDGKVANGPAATAISLAGQWSSG